MESGAVRALGASNWRASRIEEANRYAASHGLQGFTVSQIQWSLARTSPDKLGDPTLVCMTPAEYAWYREQRFPVMAYTSQAGGYFSKALSGASLSPGDQARYGCEENSRRMERVKTICARRGVTPAAVCLAAITENPLPGCAIVGFSSLARLRDTLSDASLELSPEEVAWLWDGAADKRPVPYPDDPRAKGREPAETAGRRRPAPYKLNKAGQIDWICPAFAVPWRAAAA